MTFLISMINFFLPFKQSIIRGVISMMIHVLMIYANLRFLFPKYILQKRYIIYLIGAITIIALSTFAQFFLLPPIFEGFLPGPFHDSIRYIGRLAVSMTALLLLSSLYAFVLDFLEHERKKAIIQSQQYESELKFLKSQLNPHFLFNTLNNVYSLCYLKDDKAAPIVMKLSALMRYMLYDCQATTVSLEKEVDFLYNFIELQKLKTDWEQHIDFQIIGSTKNYRIAPLIFLPFFENLSKHGDLDTNPSAKVTIQMKLSEEGILVFEMKNSIRQMPTTQNEKSGIGISNLKKRLDLVYSNQYQFVHEKTDNQFKVYLSINLLNQQ